MSYAVFLPFTNGAAYGIRIATCVTLEEARGSPYADRPGAIPIEENGDTRGRSVVSLDVLAQARVELTSREPKFTATG